MLLLALPSYAATILPTGETTFLDNNGNPLAFGKVYFYIPNTLFPKDTYINSSSTTLNTNPVVLNGSGRAIIYGSGVYRQIVKDANGNLIWDQITADTSAGNFSWAGISTGSANAQKLTAPNFTSANGQIIGFIAGFTNTGALTLSINNGPPINVVKDTPSGPIALSGGEVVANNQYQVVYDTSIGSFHLVAYTQSSQFNPVSAAPTTDIGAVGGTNITITGSSTISSLGNSANVLDPLYNIRFSGVNTLTYSNPTLILPSSADIITAPGDFATALYFGGGNWQIVDYQRASGLPVVSQASFSLSGAASVLLKNNSVTPNTQVDLSASSAMLVNSSGNPFFWSGGSLTCNILINGVNGLDTGAAAASTWYNIFIIGNQTSSTFSCLASASSSSPTLPSGYTFFMRIGALQTDASVHFFKSVQRGNRAQYQTPRTIASGAAAYANVITSVIPPTATILDFALGYYQGTVTALAGSISTPMNQSLSLAGDPTTPSAISGGNSGLTGGSLRFSLVLEVPQQVAYFGNTANSFAIADGWTDAVNAY